MSPSRCAKGKEDRRLEKFGGGLIMSFNYASNLDSEPIWVCGKCSDIHATPIQYMNAVGAMFNGKWTWMNGRISCQSFVLFFFLSSISFVLVAFVCCATAGVACGKWTECPEAQNEHMQLKGEKKKREIMAMNLVFVARNNSVVIRHSTQTENNQPKFM